MTRMSIDLNEMPYSRRGSYLCISQRHGKENVKDGLWLRSLHGRGHPDMLLMQPVKDGEVLDYELEADICVVRMITSEGMVEICLGDADLLRVRGNGVGIRLSREQNSWGECAMPAPGGRWELNPHIQRLKLMFHPINGEMKVDLKYKNPGMEYFNVTYLPGDDGIAEGAIEEFHHGWHGREVETTFDEDVEDFVAEFEEWLAISPTIVPKHEDELAATRVRAAYGNWSSLVRPHEFVKREIMFMSKNVMTACWSWDNCFNAMATAFMDTDLAWDQFIVHFDMQAPDGCIPDVITDASALWAFNKPPIQGWVIRQLEKIPGMITPERVASFYRPMCNWTRWWLDTRDYDKDGIPNYNHGNDSGWDNATCFDHGLPVESPDLAAFLVIQCEVLAEFARQLGKDDDAADWDEQAQTMLDNLIEHSWRDGAFVSPRNDDHSIAEGDCLLNFIPIVLGKRLPEEIRDAMIAALKDDGRFLAPTGYATESLRSPLYKEAGYWRGPVWAPSSMIILSGLLECGEKELVKDVALRFCRACAQSGFAENFDAKTGVSRNDSFYTWTSSVFLIFAHEYIG